MPVPGYGEHITGNPESFGYAPQHFFMRMERGPSQLGFTYTLTETPRFPHISSGFFKVLKDLLAIHKESIIIAADNDDVTCLNDFKKWILEGYVIKNNFIANTIIKNGPPVLKATRSGEVNEICSKLQGKVDEMLEFFKLYMNAAKENAGTDEQQEAFNVYLNDLKTTVPADCSDFYTLVQGYNYFPRGVAPIMAAIGGGSGVSSESAAMAGSGAPAR